MLMRAVSSSTALQNVVVVGTSIGSLHLLNWNGRMMRHAGVCLSLESVRAHQCEASGSSSHEQAKATNTQYSAVVDISGCPEWSVLGVVLRDGSAWVYHWNRRYKPGDKDNPRLVRGHCVCHSGARRISFNTRYARVAVGMSDGTVHLFMAQNLVAPGVDSTGSGSALKPPWVGSVPPTPATVLRVGRANPGSAGPHGDPTRSRRRRSRTRDHGAVNRKGRAWRKQRQQQLARQRRLVATMTAAAASVTGPVQAMGTCSLCGEKGAVCKRGCPLQSGLPTNACWQ